ncbi:MAG: hypothetical protein QM706_02500, partial [Nitrospira sp.]
MRTTQVSAAARVELSEALKAIDKILFPCDVEPASRINTTFEEYDRTAAEKAGGPYTGTGPRRLLGDTITDT